MGANPLFQDPYLNKTVQLNKHIKQTIKFFAGKLNAGQSILDIGQRSPLTEHLEKIFSVKIFNTSGDLDVEFKTNIPHPPDVVIYSHTIEHQFNPLYTLVEIRKFMKVKGLLYIMLPSRGKLLWAKGHFHEIDNYRMRLLLDRAGFEIIRHERKKHWRSFFEYFLGFRMMLRFFMEYDAYYTCRPKNI